MAFAGRLLQNVRRHWQLYVMVLPGVLLILIFNYVPMYGIQLAFREFSPKLGLAGGKFVGFKYFEKFIHAYQFRSLIENTLRISLSSLVFSFPVPILMALLFNHLRSERQKRVMQTVVYMPHFISTVVMIGMLKILFASSTSVLGRAIANLTGYTGNVMGDVHTFVPVYVLSDIWQHAGWNSIIYLAALSAIDISIYDACKIDGANEWQVIRFIDLPSLLPTFVILLILNIGTVLSVGFEKAFLMQNPLNIPVSEVISTYVYKIGLQNNQFSYSAAISLFNTVINFSFVFAMNIVAKRVGDISLW